MLNLHSHSRADLSRNHKVLDELTSMVEVAETNSGDSNADSERDSLASPASEVLSPEQFHKKFGCHGANQAYDAGVESFQGQFGGEEL